MSCPCACTTAERLLGNCVLEVARRSGLNVTTNAERHQALLMLGLPAEQAEAEAKFVEVGDKQLWLIRDKAAILAATRAPRFAVQDGIGGTA